MHRISHAAAAALLALTIGAPVQAATLGFTLVISADTSDPAALDRPTFVLTNTATVEIDFFSFNIGDELYTFDAVVNLVNSAGVGAIPSAADPNNGGLRHKTIGWTFNSFDPGEQFGFDTEIDLASGDNLQDYRTVFGNNGATNNAVATARFVLEDGSRQTLQAEFPDAGTAAGSYALAAGNGLTVTPLPAALPLIGSGLGLLALLGWRRRQRA